MPLITDPDQLNQATEVIFDTTAKTIQLLSAGNLSVDGVTIKAVYSFTKEEWKDDATLIPFEFPFVPITDEFFELVEGWNWADATTRNLLRRGGFLVRDLAGSVTEHWAGLAILGAEVDDQIYYDTGAGVTNFVYQGNTAEVVQIIDDPNGDGDYADGFNRSTSVTAYNREQGQLYSSGSTAANGEASLLAPKLFSITLNTGNDLKIAETDVNIGANTPYTNMSITYLDFQDQGAWADSTVYAANDVVLSAGRYYITLAGGTSSGTAVADDVGVTWQAFAGERQIGATYFPFGIIIDGASGTAEEIYEFVQYQLRQSTDIDAGLGGVIGQLADELLLFVGDNLETLNATNPVGDGTGVYIDNFLAADTNRISFKDNSETTRTFPFVAVVTIAFNANLQNDIDAIYRVFFTDANGNAYGSSSAILVDNNSGVDVAGTVGGNPSIQFDFDYDGNVQGGRTPGTDADITVVAIGLNSGQFVSATGTIQRSTANSVSLVSSLERQYENA